LHLMYSNKKVKVLNFVGSVYNWSTSGIWTSMTQKKQFDIQIGIWSGLKEISNTDTERKAYDKLIKQCIEKKENVKDVQREYPPVNIDIALKIASRYAGKYAFEENKEFVFRGLYFSEYIDTLSATLGKIYREKHPEFKQTESNEKTICIVASTLRPRGGGIFREMEEIIKMFSDYDVHLLCTERAESEPDAAEILSVHPHLKVHILPYDCKNKIGLLSSKYLEISPSRTYYYDSHNDTYPLAIMQDSHCLNVCLFSYDHGFVCGLNHPLLDNIICKRPVDFTMLSKRFGDKVIYIPAWNDIPADLDSFEYAPFRDHDKLITACGAARFYKLDSVSEPSYLNLVLKLLKATGGRHIHYGPIPKDKLEYIKKFISENSLPEDSFTYIEWSDDPLKLLMESNVDVFIEPFPTVSYKITLDALMAGIPVISYDGHTRMSTVDFIYQGNLLWNSEEEFINTLSNITSEELVKHSRLSKDYFEDNHSVDTVKSFYVKNEGLCTPVLHRISDDSVHEMRSYEKMYSDGRIKMASAVGNTGKIDIVTEQITVGDRFSELSLKNKIKQAWMMAKEIIKDLISSGPKAKKINQTRIKTLYNSKNHEDHVLAFGLCDSAKHDPASHIWLARMYYNGKGTARNYDKAIEFMRTSISDKTDSARNEFVDMLLKRGRKHDYEEAFSISLKYAEEGNSAAAGRLARLYRDGKGIEKNIDKAIEWMGVAADSNIGWAHLEHIDLLLRRGSEADYNEAASRCTPLAEIGNAGAAGRLARLYRDGKGVEKDINKAIEWMGVAADGDVKWAHLEHVDLLLKRSSDADYKEIITRCVPLAEAGNAGAAGRLARLYRDGKGVEKDINKAVEWMKTAIEIDKSWETLEYKFMLEERASSQNES